tara:strand:- start:199 stop:603 length:405 start_codon:yes stop_codon:yes gene_type:complete
MTIGKPIRCYPLKKKDGKFIYLPYDKTEFDITFVGDNADLETIQEYWQAIQKPEYNPRETVSQNLMHIKNNIGYWPEPLYNDNVVQTTLLEYEEDSPFIDMFKKQAAFEKRQQEGDTKRVYREPDWELDDEIPF